MKYLPIVIILTCMIGFVFGIMNIILSIVNHNGPALLMNITLIAVLIAAIAYTIIVNKEDK